MKKVIVISIIVFAFMASLGSADTFGTGANQFTVDFVTISGNASSANGTNISPWLPSQDGYKTFTDPGRDYRIGKFEITNDQWNKFKAAYGTVTGGSMDSYWTGSNVPTNSVNWHEAAQFVNYLNTSTGHQAAYKFTGTQGTGNYTFGIWNASDAGYNPSNPYRNSNAFYFLPTEDEWVKAAYWNGTSLQTYATKPGESLTQGNGISGTGWNYYTTQFATDPIGPWAVGSGSEELNGTFDMMGNIIEWMEGLYHSENYSSDSHRIVRGGAYNNEKEPFGSLYDDYDAVESTFRIWDCMPYGEYYTIGFRVASIPEPTVTLSVQVEPSNIGITTVTPSIGNHNYHIDQMVDLAASSYIQCPSVYQFDHWAGNVTNPNSASATVLMDANKTVTAVFTLAVPVCGDQCHPNFTVGDLNHDCIVDLGDFAVLASRWMNCTKPECDEVLPPVDTDPPLPNPTTITVNKITIGHQIYHVLIASVVTDPSGVEYQFECVNDPNLIRLATQVDWINAGNMVSGILVFNNILNPDGTVKVPNKIYMPVFGNISQTYRVRTRDQSPAQNTGQWSNAINSEDQVTIDVTAPSPNPAQWLTQPHSSGSNAIQMTAATATDAEGNGVQYFFECLENNNFSSGWISSSTFTLNGVIMNQVYTFRVKYRDLSSNYNQTQYSSKIAVMISDVNPPVPDPAQWTTPPYQNGVDSIRMTATAAVDPEGCGVQYAFVCSENPSLSSDWINSTEYVVSGLVMGQTYTFRVKYRDTSPFLNQTQYSVATSVTISAPDVEPPLPNPPTLTAVRVRVGDQYYHILTASAVIDPSGVEYRFECLTDPALITAAVHVDWINNVNMVSGTYLFNSTLFPIGTLKTPNKIYIPITGSVNHTYRVKTRDQSPAHNESQWSAAVTTQ